MIDVGTQDLSEDRAGVDVISVSPPRIGTRPYIPVKIIGNLGVFLVNPVESFRVSSTRVDKNI